MTVHDFFREESRDLAYSIFRSIRFIQIIVQMITVVLVSFSHNQEILLPLLVGGTAATPALCLTNKEIDVDWMAARNSVRFSPPNKTKKRRRSTPGGSSEDSRESNYCRRK